MVCRDCVEGCFVGNGVWSDCFGGCDYQWREVIGVFAYLFLYDALSVCGSWWFWDIRLVIFKAVGVYICPTSVGGGG